MSRTSVKILPNDKGNPVGKLADAQLIFEDGPLAGMRLEGFAVWESRAGAKRNVTFPARQYVVNGDRRSFALLRPTGTEEGAHDRVKEMILSAFAEHEERVRIAS